MKGKFKTILKTAAVLVIGFWVLSRIPFNQKINHEIPANIYQNGVVIGETSIIMDGEKSNYLFNNKERYNGIFYILTYEKTGRENMSASSKWNNDDNIQRLTYFQNATHPSMDIVGTLLINDKMSHFALMFTDGTVVATSDEIYQLYIKHISYDPDTRSTSIVDVNKIPKIN